MSNLGVKSFLVVIGSLLLGLVLGVMLSITVMKEIKSNHRTVNERAGHFKKMIYKVTDANEEQKILIDQVFEKRKDSFNAMEQQHRHDRKSFMDSIRYDVQEFLKPEQIKKMDERIKRFENRRKNR